MSRAAQHGAGWSLLELVTVMAIMAVIAGFAVPTYRAQSRRAYWSEAASALYRAALLLEQQSEMSDGGSDQRRSGESAGESASDSAGEGSSRSAAAPEAALPLDYARAPREGRAAYRIILQPNAGPSGDYELRAEPLDNGPMAADGDCGTFVLSRNGQRRNEARASTQQPTDAAARRCWGGF